MSVNPLDFASPDGIAFPLADFRHGVTRRIRFSVNTGGIYIDSNSNSYVLSPEFDNQTGQVYITTMEGEGIYSGFEYGFPIDTNLNSVDLSIANTNVSHYGSIAGAWGNEVNELSYEEWYEKEGYDVYHYMGSFDSFGLDIENVSGSKYIIGIVPKDINIASITPSDILLGYYATSGDIKLIQEGVILETVTRSDSVFLSIGMWNYDSELSINDNWDYCNKMTIYSRGNSPYGAIFPAYESTSNQRYPAKNVKQVVYGYCPSGLNQPYIQMETSYAYPVPIPTQLAWQNYVRTAEVNR